MTDGEEGVYSILPADMTLHYQNLHPQCSPVCEMNYAKRLLHYSEGRSSWGLIIVL